MHRKTEHYLDEICFWHCARIHLLQRAAQLRRQEWRPPLPAAADGSRQALDDLLRKCGLGELCRCSVPSRGSTPGPWRQASPGPLESKE